MRPAIIVLCLMLAGCGILRPGIPDADTGIPTPRQEEPCHVVVDEYPERTRKCVSRDHAGDILCRATAGCSPY